MQEAFWQTGDNRRAVALGLQRSGGIITSAAVIVIVVASCFATADMILVKALGLGMALAVFLDASLVRGLLVPATMRLLGDWNWWLPFVGVQRHPPALAEYLAVDGGNAVLDRRRAGNRLHGIGLGKSRQHQSRAESGELQETMARHLSSKAIIMRVPIKVICFRAPSGKGRCNVWLER